MRLIVWNDLILIIIIGKLFHECVHKFMDVSTLSWMTVIWIKIEMDAYVKTLLITCLKFSLHIIAVIVRNYCMVTFVFCNISLFETQLNPKSARFYKNLTNFWQNLPNLAGSGRIKQNLAELGRIWQDWVATWISKKLYLEFFFPNTKFRKDKNTE